MVDFAFHPAASEFPPLDEERLRELAEDIRANGQRAPIRTHGGSILDGRNRYLACRIAGIEPHIEPLPDDINPFAYVWSLNGQRRDLTQDQRYLIWKSCAAKSEAWAEQRQRLKEEANRARSEEAASQPRTKAGTFTNGAGRPTDCGTTGVKSRGLAGKAAEASGTNRGAVERMDRLERERPDLAEQVRLGQITSAQAMQTLLGPHVAHNSGDNEWYTPPEYIERAVAVMGGIDLDPASTDEANRVVRAARHYTAQDDGLAQDWRGRVFLNPPYAQPLVGRFCDKLVEHLRRGDVPQAVVLVNNATETRWFQTLLAAAGAVCFPAGRVKFWHPDKTSAPLQGQAVIYFGTEGEVFAQAFSDLGRVCHVAR